MAESAPRPDVEKRVSDHLQAIDHALAAKGVSLAERQSVTGDVEAQIRDMLAEKSGGNPTPADVEAILRKVAAPESYAEGARRAKAPAPLPPASASTSVEQAAPAGMRVKAVLIAAAVGGLVVAVLVAALALHMLWKERFDAQRSRTVGVALFYGQAWKGMLPCVENFGYTVKLHDSPLDKKFLSEIGILIIPGCKPDKQFSKEEVRQVSDFVASGGGLLCAAQAWSWVYKAYGNKPIEAFPLNALGRSLGFVITGKNVGHPEPSTTDAEVFGEIKGWNAGGWWPSEVEPLTGSATAILRDPGQHPIVLRGEFGAGRFVVAGHDGFFEDNPEAFKAVLRCLTPSKGNEGNRSARAVPVEAGPAQPLPAEDRKPAPK